MNKKFKNTAIALALSACMAFSIIGFTACEGTPGKSAYDIWLEQGNEGSEQDFLESLKGTPGKAPEITVGENGNWFVDGVDTHHKAQGESGTTPEITVGSNGNWFVNGVDTNQKAQGNTPEITVGNNGNWFVNGVDTNQKAQGNTPEITVGNNGNWFVNGVDTNQKAQGNTPEIKDGYWWIGDTNTNVKAEGTTGNRGNKITHGEGDPNALNLAAEENDMYVDTKEWNVYFFESGSWKNYGSIKGKDGSDPKPTPTPEGTEIDIAADGQKEIDVTLSEGFHIIKADLGTTTLTTGKLYAKVGEIDSELVLSETRSEAAGGNKIYYGYIDVKADTTKITISAKGEAVKGSISFEDYVQPTLKADGQPIEVPVNLNAVGTAGTGALKLKLDSSIVEGDYLVKITNTAEASHLITIGSIGLQIGDRMFTFTKRTYEGTGSSLSPTADNITNANGECWLYCPATNAPSPAIFPITITVTVKTA